MQNDNHRHIGSRALDSDATGQDSLTRNLVERVCVGDITSRAADLYPNRTAIVDGSRQLSYRELEARANRLGNALLGLGLKRGDVVGLLARNSLEFLVSYFACAKAGLICAPANLGLNADDIAYCFGDANARIIIADTELQDTATAVAGQLPALEAIHWFGPGEPPKTTASSNDLDALMTMGDDRPLETLVDDRDPVQLLYTSGTTSRPKGVLTSHLAVTFTALSSVIANEMFPGFVALVNLPLFHCALLNGTTIPTFTVGGTAVLHKSFDAGVVLEDIEHHQVTRITLLPAMYAALLSHPEAGSRELSSITRAVYAMAPMPESRLTEIHALFPNADVVLGSGQTEFTPPTCMQRPEHQWSKSASWGTPTAMTRVAIMDDAGNLLPRGETGEIVYRGPQVMNGYLNLPEETSDSFNHGWFHSGDTAWMDEDGAIWFTDRKKDIIKTGGENVASIEIERHLLKHPAVSEAAVVGLPHEYWGEAITGIVVPNPAHQPDETELLHHCREALAGFKVPKAIQVLDELPRTGTGKIQKHVLRERMKTLYEGQTK